MKMKEHALEQERLKNEVLDETYQTSVAYRFIKGIEDQIGAPGALGSEEFEPEIEDIDNDNYPEGWDDSGHVL